MSLKLLINGVALAAMAAATLVTAPTAEAREWRRGNQSENHSGWMRDADRSEGRHGGHVNRWGDVRGRDRGEGRGSFAHGRGDRWDGGYEIDRDHHDRHSSHHGRDNTARNVAIGAFAAVLGLALAAESQRVREEYYDE